MRLHVKIKATKQSIPFDHQHLLVGTIHKWLGLNEAHGKLALYSFSRLAGGKISTNGLSFQNESSFFFSAFDSELIKKMIRGIQKDSTMFEGLSVAELIIQEDPDLSNQECFYPGSPIFIKRRIDNNIVHVLYSDSKASLFLTETLKSKMEAVGMIDDTLEISFLRSAGGSSTKKINYKGVENRANWCPVLIKGKPETKLFAWNVGLGNSTGIGFGAIK
ncbi:MAG: CRISPR-associated endoribonuclease Cas6 [Alphaproteobacteria bacterium]|nr:CRISPR-associated endoribonuclease Cas6 [Alphaproteobacteria bacterium]